MQIPIPKEEWEKCLSSYEELSQGREEKWPEEDDDLKKCCCCWVFVGLDEEGDPPLFCEPCWEIRRNLELYEKTFDKRKVVFSLLKLGKTMERASVMSGLTDMDEVGIILNIRMNGLVVTRKSGRCGANILEYTGNGEFKLTGYGYW